MQLTFDILRQAWDKLKLGSDGKLRSAIPGLMRPESVIVKRVQDAPHYLTVEFKGFENAVQNPTQDIPLIKRAIQDWLRKFSTGVQIMRGESPSMIVRIDKAVRLADNFDGRVKMNKVILPEHKYEQKRRPADLTNIVIVRPAE